MTRRLAVVAILVLAGAVADAQPPRVAEPQPKIVVQPIGVQIQRLEEEVELLDAQLDTKRAYVRAAEVGVEGAKVKLSRLTRLAASGVVDVSDFESARLDVDVAKAQVDIRKAEMREVEVRLKQTKRRLDELKAPPPPPLLVPSPPKQ
jgi:multidrug resistance efflux pump